MTKFCVIGKTAGRTDSNVLRSWFDTEEKAVEHAKKLIRQAVMKHGAKSQQLFVVQAIRVVETGAPVIDVRDVNADDEVPSEED